MSKISFHHGGNWQLNIGHSLIKFTPTKRIEGKWIHGMSLQWFQLPGALEPKVRGPEGVTLIDVTLGQKLVVGLLVSTDDANVEAPRDFGQLLWHQRLRDGRSVALMGTKVRMTETDEQFGLRVRRLAAINLKERIPLTGLSAEVTEIYSDEGQGSILAIVPLGPESFRYPGAAVGSI